MINSLNNLKLTLMKIINNPNTSSESRVLAKEALDAVRQTIIDIQDVDTCEEATHRVSAMFRPTTDNTNINGEV